LFYYDTQLLLLLPLKKLWGKPGSNLELLPCSLVSSSRLRQLSHHIPNNRQQCVSWIFLLLSLVTDASTTDIGVEVQQRWQGQQWQLLGFFSVKLDGPQ
jgi:hypothetical protein